MSFGSTLAKPLEFVEAASLPGPRGNREGRHTDPLLLLLPASGDGCSCVVEAFVPSGREVVLVVVLG